MRMWLVDPRLMCNQHLLGEHVELHMLVGSIRKGKSLKGFIANGLIDTRLISSRHSSLVSEMEHRGMKHKSPLDYIDKLNIGNVDITQSLKELHSRCRLCRATQEK